MQINVTGHHVEVTEALRNYVLEKFERLERHFDHVTNVHVILSVEKTRQKAEATVHVSGAQLFAEAVEEDLYAAIDVLADRLDRQILKHKEKLNGRGRGGEHKREGAAQA
ncbi:ribosome hibernation-promoting factor, HPF/YfiA family [Inmirania thermothiophila]|uniref:Ribosome hibernation promoting factor n=1 Tax=Inmirania thermothiophila TaxID=1750597 RepID=A0A3N1XXV2_9GAMM|nr:ribosome-associated translation inhibitor RaiA [Inmirania thermothiophila]ROR29757.1 putative sigma-54 modulation protein [Inmirania thermothiophila]